MCLSSNFIIVFYPIVFLAPQVELNQLENSLTKVLCGLKTDELIKYYGYEAEMHIVTTEDGYILTVFRCNSKKHSSSQKKSIIVAHALLVSSDDFCINPPNQALAYILADAGYDVWLPNSRGNTYSRNHTFKNPNDMHGDFWDFSWYEMGIMDNPAVIEYVLRRTNNTKLYFIGHSQGTSGLLILLSERPEYNEKLYAASLMTPTAYFRATSPFLQIVEQVTPLLQPLANSEIAPRSHFMATFIKTLCANNLLFCNSVIDFLAGPSDNHRNLTMFPVFLCHASSGASLKQIIHYGQQIKFGHFGPFKNSSEIPRDFPLSRITVPLSFHVSTTDTVTPPAEVQKLLSKLSSTKVHVQTISNTKLNHVDFLWGMNSASLVYTNILEFFKENQ